MKSLSVIGLFISTCALAQQEDTVRIRKLEVRGYVKDMQTLTFDKTFNQLVTNNLIHNRLNFRWNAAPSFRMGMELRNRLYWGEEVRNTPNFSDHLRNANEAINMSIIWFETPSMVLHTNVDRLWMEYANDKITARLGRQRINWGIGSTWNPNDLFNTFNFLDFDYEERPGSDAIDVQYRTGPMSHLEVTGALTESDSIRGIAAVRYFFNKANYDIQLIGGIYFDQVTAGVGWTGSLGGTGFKGEVQYYFSGYDTARQLNLVVEGDRVFAHGWYASAGMLYNNAGLDKPVTQWETVSLVFSPRNLMPTKWNVLATVAKDITPLLRASAGLVYAPGTNLMIILPTVQYNLATNLDVSLVWQSFFAEQLDQFEAVSHRAYLRFKLSF